MQDAFVDNKPCQRRVSPREDVLPCYSRTHIFFYYIRAVPGPPGSHDCPRIVGGLKQSRDVTEFPLVNANGLFLKLGILREPRRPCLPNRKPPEANECACGLEKIVAKLC